MRRFYFTFTVSVFALFSSVMHAFPVTNGFAPGFVQGESAVITQYQHLNAYVNRNSPSFYPFDSKYTVDAVAFGALHAVTPNFILYLFCPWTEQEFRFSPPPTFDSNARQSIKTSGWGDLSFSAGFRPWSVSGEGWFASSIIRTGVQFPTGDWNQKYKGVIVDREFQPGTGNWSPFLSIATSLIGIYNEVALQVQYQPFFKGHGFRHGQRLIYNASVGHRIIPWFLKSGTNRFWGTFSLEFLGNYKSRPSGGPNLVNTWSNWGSFGPALSLDILDLFKTFNINVSVAFQQTVYFQTGDAFPFRPERQLFVRLLANW